MVTVEKTNNVAVVKLDRSVTNALNLEHVNAISEALEEVKADGEVRSVVLASASDKFYSIGFDIPELYGLSRDEFTFFFKSFNRVCFDLYTLPKPTIAAITGHATAGGCILAICCDFRIISEGKKLMGLNEVKLGVTVPYLADLALKQITGVRYARDIMEGGEFYPPEESLRMGLVDEVVPLDQVTAKAVEKATAFGSFPNEGYSAIKQNRIEMVEEQVLMLEEDKEQYFIELWYSREVRERLEEAIARF